MCVRVSGQAIRVEGTKSNRSHQGNARKQFNLFDFRSRNGKCKLRFEQEGVDLAISPRFFWAGLNSAPSCGHIEYKNAWLERRAANYKNRSAFA